MHQKRHSSEYIHKHARPFSQKKCLHVVLRSHFTTLRQRKNRKLIGDLLHLYSHRFHVRVYQNALNSTHIHLLCYAKEKESLQNFLRVFAGQVAQRMTSSKKGKALTRSFWSKIAWSRVVEWGRAFKIATQYILQNQRESLGLVAYTPRRHKTFSITSPLRLKALSLMSVTQT